MRYCTSRHVRLGLQWRRNRTLKHWLAYKMVYKNVPFIHKLATRNLKTFIIIIFMTIGAATEKSSCHMLFNSLKVAAGLTLLVVQESILQLRVELRRWSP